MALGYSVPNLLVDHARARERALAAYEAAHAEYLDKLDAYEDKVKDDPTARKPVVVAPVVCAR